MQEPMSDEALGRLLRSIPEPEVPAMAPLRLPPRPPRIPWERGEVLMLSGAAAVFCALAVWLLIDGPVGAFDFTVRALLVPGGLGQALLTAVAAGLVGWLAVLVATPRPAA